MAKPDLPHLILGWKSEGDPGGPRAPALRSLNLGPPSLQATSSRAMICIFIHLNNPVSQGFGISSSQRDPTPGHQGYPLTLAFCLPAPLFAGKLWAFSQYRSHPAEETGASSGQPPHPVSVLVMRAYWGRLGAGTSVVRFHSQSAIHDPGPCSSPRSWRETRTGPCPPGTQRGKGGASPWPHRRPEADEGWDRFLWETLAGDPSQMWVGWGMVREDFLEEVVFELDFERCIGFHWDKLRQEHLVQGVAGPRGPN